MFLLLDSYQLTYWKTQSIILAWAVKWRASMKQTPHPAHHSPKKINFPLPSLTSSVFRLWILFMICRIIKAPCRSIIFGSNYVRTATALAAIKNHQQSGWFLEFRNRCSLSRWLLIHSLSQQTRKCEDFFFSKEDLSQSSVVKVTFFVSFTGFYQEYRWYSKLVYSEVLRTVTGHFWTLIINWFSDYGV